MARNRLMLRFARWHIWLGWVVALPVLMWLVTGLVMVARRPPHPGHLLSDRSREAPRLRA